MTFLVKEDRVLVLSRKSRETIRIGDSIAITVIDVRGEKVRLGIVAPSELAVHRQEIYERIAKETR